MFKKSVLNVSVAAALLLASGITSAASATTSIPVSASVAKGCTISVGATPLAFGAYDPIGANATAPLTATGSVIVTCAKNSSGLTIGMGLGSQPLAGVRQMISGVDLLAYDVGQPSSNAAGAACTFPATTAWTDVAVLALTNPPSKAPRTYNVCGSIPAGQDVAAGLAYTDTVVATINF
ncbi:MAG: spore coat protein U domain-containing protein [Burkholderiales bacterium]|nr:spore coat protein U domain-containing protein [Burkholderiales bacterium]